MKRWWLYLALALILLMITACTSSDEVQNNGGNNVPNQTKSSEQTQTKEESLPPEPEEKDWTSESFELVFFANNMETQEDVEGKYGQLMLKFPNLKFKYIQATEGNHLEDLLATNTRFDIFFNSIGNFENQAFQHEIQYDMTDLIEKHEVDIDLVEPALMDGIRQASNGNIYMLPIQSNNFVVFYNKGLFDQFGVDYPYDGMTWDEMTELSVTMSRVEDGQIYVGYAHSAAHMPRLNPMSLPKADMETGMPTVNTDDRWQMFYQKFFVDPFRSPVYDDYFEANDGRIPALAQFGTDKNVAMFPYLSSLMRIADDYLDIDWDVVAMPTLEGYEGVGTMPYPVYIGMTKMAENKDAAMQALKYLISPEYQTIMTRKGTITSLNDEKVQAEFGKELIGSAQGKNVQAVFYHDLAPIAPMGPYDSNLAGIYAKHGTEITRRNVDINTARRLASEEAEALIKEREKMN